MEFLTIAKISNIQFDGLRRIRRRRNALDCGRSYELSWYLFVSKVANNCFSKFEILAVNRYCSVATSWTFSWIDVSDSGRFVVKIGLIIVSPVPVVKRHFNIGHIEAH